MTDNWMTPEHQAAALEGIDDRIAHQQAAMNDDPIAAGIGRLLDSSVAGQTGSTLGDRDLLTRTALKLAAGARLALVERDLHLVPGARLHYLEAVEQAWREQTEASIHASIAEGRAHQRRQP